MNNVFKSKEITDYFKDRKHKPKKVVTAQVDRAKWDVVKEYAMFRGCPQKLVEDALVCFALDHAYQEAGIAQETPGFKAWLIQKAMKLENKAMEAKNDEPSVTFNRGTNMKYVDGVPQGLPESKDQGKE